MDAEVFKQRVLPYHRKLYRIAFRLLENSDEAEDVLQDAYTRLWQKRGTLAAVDNLEAFCVVMVRNMCLDVLKSARMRQDPLGTNTADVTVQQSVLSTYENKESMRILQEVLETFPLQHQQIFKLRHIDDCSMETIQQITGLQAVHIRVLLSRIRKKLKERIKEVYTYESQTHTGTA